jgi:hypothetical protein
MVAKNISSPSIAADLHAFKHIEQQNAGSVKSDAMKRLKAGVKGP